MNMKEDVADYVEMMAGKYGMDLGEIAAQLAERAASGADVSPTSGPSGITLAEYLPVVEQATRGQLTETQRTYRTYWLFLAEGIHLRSKVTRHGHTELRAWDDDRVERWLDPARTINAERDLGLDLPERLDAYDRDEVGAVVVWRGNGHLPLGQIVMTRVMTATNWQLLLTLTTAALRDEKRLAEGRPRCGWTEVTTPTSRMLGATSEPPADGSSPRLEVVQPQGQAGAPRRMALSLFNHRRLLEPIGMIPPAEHEAAYYRQHATPTDPVGVNE